jgi:mono/diheme cytochrome c family protein
MSHAVSRVSPAIVACVLALAGCAAEHRSAPAVGPFVPANAEQARGERVYFIFCHQCHPGGAAGLGPAINDKPLPEFAMRTQIRAGAGAMPSFTDREIPDPDLDAVLAYIVALRGQGD